MALIIGPGIEIGAGIGITSELPSPGSAQFVNAFPAGQYLSTTVTAPSTDSITYEWWARRTSNTPTIQGMLQTRTSTSGSDGRCAGCKSFASN